MPIPSSIADLSTTAGSNSPAGSDPPTEGDNYLRAIQAILKTADNDRVAGSAALSAAHASFAAALGTSATFTQGAGLVSFDPELAYAAPSLGWMMQRVGVTPTMMGCAGDGVTDDTVRLNAWAALTLPKMGEPRRFKVTGQITFAAGGMNFDGRGMVIDASAGGSFSDAAVLYSTGGLTQIADLSASPAARSRSLSFASAHGRTVGDICIIYNPTDSSWNTSYTYSRAGEFFRVAAVTSSTALKMDNPLHAGYTAAAVDVYAMAQNDVRLSNLTVIAPNSGNVRPIRIRLATKVQMRNVEASGSNAIQIDLDRCYAVRLDGLVIDNRTQLAAATYGLSIGNSQHVTVSASQINATRHSVNIGGDDFAGCVVNRDITVDGCTLRNDSALSQVPCADIHANCEGVVYRGNRIYGGGSLAGKDCSYIDNTFEECDVSVGAMLQGGSQWVGGYAKVIGNTFVAGGAYANGLIRLFVDTTNANHDSHLVVRDNVVSLGACDVFCRVDNDDATLKGNAHVSGVTFLDSASLANVLRMSGTGTGDYAIVDDIRNGLSGASLFVEAGGYVVTKVSLMEQRGTVAITPVSAAASASSSVTFRYSYGSRTPVMSLVLDQDTVNTKTPVPRVGSVSAAGFGAYIKSGDNTNFGAVTPVVNGHWSAAVAEV